MKRKTAIIGLTMVLAFQLVFAVELAHSKEAFPAKKIDMYCGFTAGGGTDLVGRKIAIGMEKHLGVPVVVINKPGGAGLVSIKALVASPPDGYTVAIMATLNGFIQKHMKDIVSWVDPIKELIPVGFVNSDYWGIAVKSDAPYNTMSEFIQYLNKNPGAKVSDTGPGSGYHWGWEAFMDTTGVKVTTVAYGGTSLALKALAGGELTASATSAPEASSLVSAGLIKVLGISAEERSPVYPDMPTLKEQGIDLVYGITRCIVAPAGTPEQVVDKLAEAVKVAYDSSDYQEFLKSTGYGSFYLGPKEGMEYFKKLDQMFIKLMGKAGLLRQQ